MEPQEQIDLNKLIENERAGRIRIGVDPAIARKFFTDVSILKMRDETGENVAIEKGIISTLLVLEYVFLAAALAIAPFAFHWWALVVIPVSFVAAFLYGSSSSAGRQGGVLVTLVLACAIAFSVLGYLQPIQIGAFAILLSLSLWCSRMKYVWAVRMFRNLAIRNARTFELFKKTLMIREAT